MPSFDEVIHHSRLQWAGPKQRNERDQVLETVGSEFPDEIGHASRLELKDSTSAAFLEQFECRRIIQRDVLHNERRLARV